ncbi:MAG: winged helix-turn-helix domain-containing protein [Terrisporobacter sp.]|uniref:winged helix-turn-helix domain-containing protein n=1 Tax=Terrisporobacter sp. TaxID=1965305 RepID=UPI002A909410|nr:winged helix-turn-helix domain-containing protein [Terrisporobacter sp.]MDY6154234.1 winged helix-turn-helix domain-containing protein [Terrisporobacter sp.]
MKPLKRVVIKEELVELTGDFRPALILNQFIYWSERMYDADKYIMEEKERALKEDLVVNIDESKGWIYKTAEELSEEIMTGMSQSTIGRYIKQLVDKGYLIKRRNPKYKWDKTYQYRVNLYKIQLDLGKMGYVLEGYKLLPNIKIVEEIESVEEAEEIIEDIKENENKKTPTFAEVEADENKNLIDDNIIPQEEENYASNFMEDDIEAKNKKLMEQEKRFIPSFDMRWN